MPLLSSPFSPFLHVARRRGANGLTQPCPRPWDGAEGFYLYLHGAEVEKGGGRGFPSARELPPLAPLFLFLSFKSSVEALGMRSHSQLKLKGREKETSPIHSPS